MTKPPITLERLREICATGSLSLASRRETASGAWVIFSPADDRHELLSLMRWLGGDEPGCSKTPWFCFDPNGTGTVEHDEDCAVTQHRAARAPFIAELKGGGE